MHYTIGQRWASLTETHLGLGVITHIENRRLQIHFPASNETRLYAVGNAPLTRINYTVGDQVSNKEEQAFTLTGIHEREGLFYYDALDQDGKATTLDERDLNCFVHFSAPQQRLFNGQVDSNQQFELRARTLALLQACEQSPVKGLLGSRTNLLPHQVYIAHEVAQRHAPRVLLADEVGLGKTIEAGMILHHQILTGQVSRVLILVPDSLVHQWLVEMLRKFNLHFAIFDQARLDACDSDTPFDSEQLILCPLSLLSEQPSVCAQALASDWDMVIVDEAHHLLWSETEASPQYQCVEQLARVSAGLLLLTATPEQVGISGHFARLRLLDPARFHDLAQFTQEQEQYITLNTLVTALQHRQQHQQPLSEQQQQQLADYLGAEALKTQDTEALIAQLLDRHGTGRVLFRNTRAAIAGFPQRCHKAYALTHNYALEAAQTLEEALYPEQQLKTNDWLTTDPRVNWLVDKLKQLHPEQLLVICHHANTAIALDHYLNQRVGIRSSCFHEGLSIVERDRAAAYFAEGNTALTESTGAQTLICSEIGSEGRNFQFTHHLVLFDLPLNPDLLEQRIGRLDRIGQQHTIQLHIPYLQDSAQHRLYQWYHRGLNVFQRSCSAAYSIYQQYADTLHRQLLATAPAAADVEQLLTDAQATTTRTLAALHQGRDQLLERNSCKPQVAADLITAIKAREDAEALQDYMEAVFEQYQLDSQYHSKHCIIVRATDRSQGHFPSLRDEGNTLTFTREKAIVREDMDFLSWEHPMVTDAMEMIYRSELGNSALATVSIKGLDEGSLLLESFFTLDVIADKKLGLQHYLPLNPTRFLVANNKRDYDQVLPHHTLSQLCNKIPNNITQAVIAQTKPTVLALLAHSETLAGEKSQQLRTEALATLRADLGAQAQRLRALRAVNPSIREEEIRFIEHRIAACSEHIQRASLQLNALRIIINSP